MRTLHIVDVNRIPTSYFQYYRVMDRDTWPLISFKVYNTVELWWLLMKLNNVLDPMFEPEKDTSIRYVSAGDVNTILQLIQNS